MNKAYRVRWSHEINRTYYRYNKKATLFLGLSEIRKMMFWAVNSFWSLDFILFSKLLMEMMDSNWLWGVEVRHKAHLGTGFPTAELQI